MKRLTADEVSKTAGAFIAGMEDGTDLSNDIETFFYHHFPNEDCTTLSSIDNQNRVEKRVSKSLKALADVLNQNTASENRKKAIQRARVRKMLATFPLHYDKLDINIDELCEVLYGPGK